MFQTTKQLWYFPLIPLMTCFSQWKNRNHPTYNQGYIYITLPGGMRHHASYIRGGSTSHQFLPVKINTDWLRGGFQCFSRALKVKSLF
jgi:hypothetical protein